MKGPKRADSSTPARVPSGRASTPSWPRRSPASPPPDRRDTARRARRDGRARTEPEGNALMSQLDREGSAIHGLEKPEPKLPVHDEARCDDSPRELLHGVTRFGEFSSGRLIDRGRLAHAANTSHLGTGAHHRIASARSKLPQCAAQNGEHRFRRFHRFHRRKQLLLLWNQWNLGNLCSPFCWAVRQSAG